MSSSDRNILVFIKNLLVEVRTVSFKVLRLQQKVETIEKDHQASEKTNEKLYKFPRRITADVNFESEVVNRYYANYHKPNSLQWATFGVAVLTLLAVGVYAYIAGLQHCDFREANRISRDTAKKQLRPYVGVEPSFLENLAPNSTTTVQGTATNYGQTPAYRTRIYFDVQVLPYPFPDNLQFPFSPPKGTDFGSVATLFPHTPLPAGKKMVKPLTKDEVLGIYDGTKIRLYVGGEIWYDDIYDTPYCARFFFSLGGQELVEWADAVRLGQKRPPPWRVWKKFNDEKCQN